MADAAPSLVARALKLVTTARRAAEAYGRPDLVDRLSRAEQRVSRPDLHALVVGEFKQGKSTLVNALLNVPLCPVSDEVATVVPTIVRHGTEATAAVLRPPPATEPGGLAAETGSPEQRTTIPLEEIPAWASERGNTDNARGIQAVEITVPRQLLRSGLALVDTPGVGGLHSTHGAATMAALGMAEVVVFVTDASQELSAVELEVLRAAAARAPTVVCVLTKIDLYPAWRRIAELDREHLAAAGVGHVDVLPVSSLVRQEALRTSSKALNDESGYPALLRFLDESVLSRAQQVSVRTAVSDVLFVLDQLEGTFLTERDVLLDPAGARPLMDELERARHRAEALRTRSARWQQTLADGSQDLASEVEYDLRRRLREVSNEAEEAIERHDPAKIWDDFSAWVRTETAAHVADNAEVLRTSANSLAERVAEHFAIEEQAVVHAVDTGSAPMVDAPLDLEVERVARGSGVISAMRGSYGGLLMFGMLGQAIGLTMLNPLTAVIAVGMGRRALKDEHKRQITMRRQQAKQAVRRFLDDVSFSVTKESTRRAAPDPARPARRVHRAGRPAAALDPRVPGGGGGRGSPDGRAGGDPHEGHRRRAGSVGGRAHRGQRARRGLHGGRLMAALVDDVRGLVAEARRCLAGRGADDALDAIEARLDEPLRVAFAGRVKAGKSTLLNALVGEEVAPTDAGECTRIVTWYHDGHTYRVTLVRRDGTSQQARFTHDDGALDIDLAGVDPADIERIDVVWPSSRLGGLTLIDTPGLGSGSEGASAPSERFLAIETDGDAAGPTEADAVLYLMRHLHQADLGFLEAFHDVGLGAASPVNTLAILSRADEVGACRPEAMQTARRIAVRYRSDPRLRRLCQTVLPVSGLLAQAAVTLTEAEYRALRALAELPRGETDALLLTVDRFVADVPAPVVAAEREQLLARLGLYGVRTAVRLIRLGAAETAPELAAQLRELSGIEDLRGLLATLFTDRQRRAQGPRRARRAGGAAARTSRRPHLPRRRRGGAGGLLGPRADRAAPPGRAAQRARQPPAGGAGGGGAVAGSAGATAGRAPRRPAGGRAGGDPGGRGAMARPSREPPTRRARWWRPPTPSSAASRACCSRSTPAENDASSGPGQLVTYRRQELGPGGRAQLLADSGDVVLDRLGGDVELGPDLAVGAAVQDAAGDLPFALGERGDGRGADGSRADLRAAEAPELAEQGPRRGGVGAPQAGGADQPGGLEDQASFGQLGRGLSHDVGIDATFEHGREGVGRPTEQRQRAGVVGSVLPPGQDARCLHARPERRPASRPPGAGPRPAARPR